mgnify:CR=1 FL=1
MSGKFTCTPEHSYCVILCCGDGWVSWFVFVLCFLFAHVLVFFSGAHEVLFDHPREGAAEFVRIFRTVKKAAFFGICRVHLIWEQYKIKN